jgi:DNA-directed RNA polymerase specialized sigma24 family protein
MRQHLIDIARARRREQVVRIEELEDSLPGDFDNLELLVSVGRLLDQLAETNPNWSLVVELKYFLGFTDKETAATMGIKLRTVQRMWAGARDWLFDRAGSLR